MNFVRSPGVLFRIAVLLFIALGLSSARAETDPLPSWEELPGKHRIVAFVRQVTTPDSPDYLPPAARVAVFDNDGTLWVEQPLYAQMAFTLDRIREMAPQHPEWRMKEPFRAAVDNDFKDIPTGLDFFELMIPTHTGMTTEVFRQSVEKWVREAKHPHFRRPYLSLAYQPMVELLAFLEKNGFKNYIVSGGEVEFVRAFSQSAYGVSPDRVIGSALRTAYEERKDGPAIVRTRKIADIANGKEKALLIDRIIGIRPVIAVGNSDGDYEMLAWTTSARKGLGVLIHHTDEAREYAYDRHSTSGTLEKALDDASRQGWLVIDMKRDWRRIFSEE